MDFAKTMIVGHELIGKRREKVWVNISYRDGRLSFTGEFGPRASGNARGSCGQIEMSMPGGKGIIPVDPWNQEMVTRLFNLWNRWHLNDMQAGTPKQMEALRDAFGSQSYSHDQALEVLDNEGILVDRDYLHNGKPYRYGSAWLHEDVPEHVLQWLRNLPETDLPHPWQSKRGG